MKRKGFTLIETLLVVFLIGILATVAIQSYVNSTKTFKFLAGYQQVTSALRTARSNALSNKQQGGISPKGYGVCVSSTTVLTFADTGQKTGQLDLTDNTYNRAVLPYGTCIIKYDSNPATPQDTVLMDKLFTFNDYKVYSYDQANIGKMYNPAIFYYENGTGNLTIFDSSGAVIPKSTVPVVQIIFTEPFPATLVRYINVNQVSGLAEESSTQSF